MGMSVEFYLSGRNKYMAVVHDCGAVPAVGQYINIANVTYKVCRVTWCVDRAETREPHLRANVDLVLQDKP